MGQVDKFFAGSIKRVDEGTAMGFQPALTGNIYFRVIKSAHYMTVFRCFVQNILEV